MLIDNVKHLLPCYFKHANLSFIRILQPGQKYTFHPVVILNSVIKA